jgi:hypothetical protein
MANEHSFGGTIMSQNNTFLVYSLFPVRQNVSSIIGRNNTTNVPAPPPNQRVRRLAKEETQKRGSMKMHRSE